jgi:class 3 adenylate cyclase
MQNLITRGVLAVAFGLSVVACGGSGSDASGSDAGSSDAAASTDSGPTVDEMTAVLVEQGAPEDEARCVAENLDDVSLEELRAFGEADDPEDLPEELLVKIGLAVGECGVG